MTFHFTCTAPLKVSNYIFIVLDGNQCTGALFIDLSKAFDLVITNYCYLGWP